MSLTQRQDCPLMIGYGIHGGKIYICMRIFYENQTYTNYNLRNDGGIEIVAHDL